MSESGYPRQIPRWSTVRPMLRLRSWERDRTERILRDCLTIEDLRRAARRRAPVPVFDYVDGAAEEEISLGRARATFRNLEFVPSVLRDVSHADPSSEPLGRRSALPFAFAPTGFTRMMHHEGETAVARVAGRHGIPYALSTMGTTSLEDLRRMSPGGRLWFQLYVWRDRAAALDLVQRAQSAGYEALLLTVDVPVAGARLRDVRNGFSVPPSLTARSIAGVAARPSWWWDLLTTRPLEFASLTSWDGTVGELIDSLFDPTMTVEDLAWLRSVWSGPLVVKGIQSVTDAVRVVDAGADAVILSNHGGRQLDRAPVPLTLVEPVRQVLGDRAEVWVDTGVMSGADVLAAYALGASQVLVGRAYLYGLMAGGERGVERVVEILTNQVERTMKLLGVTSLHQLTPDHVRLQAAR